MRKQNLKKLSVKIFIAVFIINTVCIFGFSNSSLATQNLSVSASPSPYFIDNINDIKISWYAVKKSSSTYDQVTFGGYYSYVYVSYNDGVWQHIATRSGTGSKSCYYRPNEVGTYSFKVKEIATKIYYPGGQSSTNTLIGEGIIENFKVNSPYADYNPNAKLLFGSTDRKLPSPDDSKVEFIVGTLDSINNLNPEISFKLYQTIDPQVVTRINIKVDNNLILECESQIKSGYYISRTIPTDTLSLEGTHIISIEVLDLYDDNSDNDKYTLEYVKISNLNFVDCEETFTFDYDTTNSNPNGWLVTTPEFCRDDNAFRIVDVDQVDIEGASEQGKLLKIQTSYVNVISDQILEREFIVGDVYSKIIHLKFDYAYLSNANMKIGIHYFDIPTPIFEFHFLYNILRLQDTNYWSSSEYVNLVWGFENNVMYNVELDIYFEDIGENDIRIWCDFYIDNIYGGTGSIPIYNLDVWDDITSISDISITTRGNPLDEEPEVYLDNIYMGYTTIE
ncbi:MAG: hypothetical protein KGD63_05190 [Candidatus Lokiarchaeota archaeon]|nr:hypothetical protein [Candidatus Lokiarchaeota archaeon]